MFKILEINIFNKLTLILLILFQINSFPAKSNEFKKIDGAINLSKNTLEEDLRSEYILGEGDTLYIEFVGLEIFSGNYSIGLNSEILLPEIGNIEVSGLTRKDLKEQLEKIYEEIIFNPIINISIVGFRDINFQLIGEVKRPGLYLLKNNSELITKNLSGIGSTLNASNQLIRSDSKSNFSIPSLFNALQSGSGVTNQADLSSIELRRINSKKQGGGQIKTTINLMKLFEEGDASQNIRLQDGDIIIVKKSPETLKNQLSTVQKSNLNPPTIGVYITGNIREPGLKVLPQGSSLYEAIASAGGRSNFTGNIEFIRFKSDGKTEKKIMRYKNKQDKYSNSNPMLYDGDIINVRLNPLGKATAIIEEVGSPIISGYGLYKIFD